MWTKTAVNVGKNTGGPDGWHYAQVWKDGGGPIGYCRDHDLHPTEAEARECYAQYERDHVRLDARSSWTSCEVDGCDKPADKGARIEGDPYHHAALCDEHLTMEHALTALHLTGPAGDSFGS